MESITNKAGEGWHPPVHCGVRAWMRHHLRRAARPVKIKNPEKYLHTVARRRLGAA